MPDTDMDIEPIEPDMEGDFISLCRDPDTGGLAVIMHIQPGASTLRSALGLLIDVYGEQTVKDALDIVTAF